MNFVKKVEYIFKEIDTRRRYHLSSYKVFTQEKIFPTENEKSTFFEKNVVSFKTKNDLQAIYFVSIFTPLENQRAVCMFERDERWF